MREALSISRVRLHGLHCGSRKGGVIRPCFTPPLLNLTGASSANEMLHLFYTPDWPRSRIATLASLVDQVRSEGDLTARNILEQAAQNLAALAGLRSHPNSRHRGKRGSPTSVVRFRSSAVLERFRMLVELTDGCECIAPELSPAEGALLMARRAAGLAC